MHYYSAIHFLFSKSLGQKRTDHKANHITKDNFTHVCIFQFSTTCKKKKKKRKKLVANVWMLMWAVSVMILEQHQHGKFISVF